MQCVEETLTTEILDPALVYSELMYALPDLSALISSQMSLHRGVICGNEGTINTPDGHLDREAYMALSHRVLLR